MRQIKEKAFLAALPATLLVYSIALVTVELGTSQDYVRQYFADIEGEVPFFAVNTTLSASMFAGSALLLLFAAVILGRMPERRAARAFLVAQSALFGLLAFDDRFQLHEILNYRLGIGGDHYVMVIWGMLELALLGLFFRKSYTTAPAIAMFAAGAAFGGVMLIFDVFIPHDMPLRLSLEDLAKAWGAAMFFGASWETARFQLQGVVPLR